MEKRFYSKISKTDDCWLWHGTITDRGYGHFWDGKSMRRAHVISYELNKGLVPNGLELDHLCRNRLCVNPHHLEAVTHKENCQRGIGSKTHCARGHEFTNENTRHTAIQRQCKQCMRRRMKEYRLRKKQPVV